MKNPLRRWFGNPVASFARRAGVSLDQDGRVTLPDDATENDVRKAHSIGEPRLRAALAGKRTYTDAEMIAAGWYRDSSIWGNPFVHPAGDDFGYAALEMSPAERAALDKRTTRQMRRELHAFGMPYRGDAEPVNMELEPVSPGVWRGWIRKGVNMLTPDETLRRKAR